MAQSSPRPGKWAKRSAEGYPMPRNCPFCFARKTVLAKYADGSRAVECEGCHSVIHEYGHEPPPPPANVRPGFLAPYAEE